MFTSHFIIQRCYFSLASDYDFTNQYQSSVMRLHPRLYDFTSFAKDSNTFWHCYKDI